MKRRQLLALALALALGLPALASAAQASATRPFSADSFGRIRAAHAGAPLVVHVWGMTCGPCLVELPRWGQLLRRHPRLPLVLIQADAGPRRAAEQTLAGAGLAGAESWALTDEPDEFMRASIDPQWAGEMPHTLLIAADGSVTRISGSADMAAVERWVAQAGR